MLVRFGLSLRDILREDAASWTDLFPGRGLRVAVQDAESGGRGCSASRVINMAGSAWVRM